MNGGHITALLFWLIFAGIVARHWQGANALLGTAGTQGGNIIGKLEA